MGGYKFSRRIGRGGMAEVFLAMREGLAGFEKLVVVKRIFPHFCEDERFVKMFLDEARLAASIRHPNVVEILDISRDDEGYMMVMEYLSGETLALVFETLRAQQVTMPAPIVARIGADIAAGLHYAHTATDASGHVLEIVHRDVTPSNLIVCFNGTTKIVDFGIAKAQIRDSQTRSGALKGKMAYLSPEQVEDGDVDARTDVFQLGICLHEMFTGQRLFDADGDHQKMMAVLERPIRPPSEINPYVPRAFDEVVLRALNRDAKQRTQTADQLRRELEYALKQVGTTVSDHDVADWMQTTFSSRYDERVAMERQCVTQMRAGVPSSDSMPVQNGSQTPTLATVVGRKSSTVHGRPPRKKMAAALVGAGAVVGAALGVFLFLRSSGNTDTPKEEPKAATVGVSVEGVKVTSTEDDNAAPTTAPIDAAPKVIEKTVRVAMLVQPETARFMLDGEEVGVGSYADELVVGATPRELVIEGDCFESKTYAISDSPPPARVSLKPSTDPKCVAIANRDQSPTKVAGTKGPRDTGKSGGKKPDNKGPEGGSVGPDGKTVVRGNGSATSPTGDTGVKSGGEPGNTQGDTKKPERDGPRTSDNLDPWKD